MVGEEMSEAGDAAAFIRVQTEVARKVTDPDRASKLDTGVTPAPVPNAVERPGTWHGSILKAFSGHGINFAVVPGG